MNEIRWKTLGPEGLRFFGKVCADLSHEIKNSLATINEQNGLLDDFLTMAEQGAPLDPVRIHKITRAVAGHVERANKVVNKLNRFAHSVDHSRRQVELDVLVRQACELYERPAAIKGVVLTPESLQQGINIRTNPFLLQQLLLTCFEHASARPSPDSTLSVVVERTPGHALISMTGSGPDTNPVLDELLDELEAGITGDADGTWFRIRIPLRVDAEHVST
jgi:C4-dicarboxylate-specific signal transduction histidine kinase